MESDSGEQVEHNAYTIYARSNVKDINVRYNRCPEQHNYDGTNHWLVHMMGTR